MPSPSIVLLRTQSDARLVALAREGHERAFEAIVERYRRQLLRSCRRILPEGRAEDALQHALMAAWRGFERGDEVRELRPWLHRIAHNTALNLLRQSGYDYDELHESLRSTDAPGDELERRAVVRHTLQGLAALPQRQREALLAIAVEGRSQEEVAGELGLSTGAVRQLVHRARTALRAAATAVVPLPVVSWAASAAGRGEMAGRVAELTAGAGGLGASTVLAKAGTVVVLAGGAVGGPALVQERGGGDRATRAAAAEPRPARERLAATETPRAAPAAAVVRAPARRLPVSRVHRVRPQRHAVTRRSSGGSRREDDSPARDRSGPGPSDGGSDRSGHGGDPSDVPAEDRSGPSGEDRTIRQVSRSGPGGGTDAGGAETRSGSSGSGSSGSGSSGSGDGVVPVEAEDVSSSSGPGGGDDATDLSGSSGHGGLEPDGSSGSGGSSGPG